MARGPKPWLMFTPLYNGLFSEWTMSRKFQLTMARHPLTVAMAEAPALPFSPLVFMEIQHPHQVSRIYDTIITYGLFADRIASSPCRLWRAFVAFLL